MAYPYMSQPPSQGWPLIPKIIFCGMRLPMQGSLHGVGLRKSYPCQTHDLWGGHLQKHNRNFFQAPSSTSGRIKSAVRLLAVCSVYFLDSPPWQSVYSSHGYWNPSTTSWFQQVVAFIELLISTGWRIHRVVDFNTLQVVDFNRLRLNMPMQWTKQGRPLRGRPCVVNKIVMFSPGRWNQCDMVCWYQHDMVCLYYWWIKKLSVNQ